MHFTAQDVTNGTVGKSTSRPTFDKNTDDKHYRNKYVKEVEIN